GSFQQLSQKALKLVGGPDSPQAPPGRTVYGMLLEKGKADIFLTYCTNALQARKENPAFRIVDVPPALAVGADYGLTVIKGSKPQAERFAQFVVSRAGQAILVKHGFAPGDPQ
ncbi:MAG TPA: substrate-binding domain-containing protein, partial [Burkholderiales bacterium]|nr:substrate-binding domain-containing protein [Burkholderiales bacterium]